MLAVESFDPRLIWDRRQLERGSTCLTATRRRRAFPSRAPSSQEAHAALARLDRPDRRGAGRRLGRGDPHPGRGADDHDRLRLGRGARGRQDQDPLQRRRRRHAHDDPPLGRPPAASSPPRRWRPRPRASWSTTRSFWVVRPRISGANVTGLGTLISGAYIGMEIGESKRAQARLRRRSTTPPVVTGDVPGRFFVAEDARPRLARHRHADLLPPPAGRRGRVVRARQGRPGADASRSSSTRRTTSTSPRTRASGRRAASTCRSPRAASACRRSRCSRS